MTYFIPLGKFGMFLNIFAASIIFILCGASDPEQTESKVILDLEIIKKLSRLEDHLVEYISTEIDSISLKPQNTCYKQVKKYVLEYEKDIKVINKSSASYKANSIAENPLLILRLVRRICTNLFTDIIKSCRETKKLRANLHSVFEIFEVPLIKQVHVNEALKAVLRIHYVYSLNATSDIRKGILQGVKTGVKLNFGDCVALAKAALEFYKADILAYQWLVAATEILVEEHLSVDTQVANTELEEIWSELLKFTKLKSKKDVREVFHGKIQKSVGKSDGLFYYPYYQTCKGETGVPFRYQKLLSCYYEKKYKPYFFLSPVKVEVLSLEPVIAQLHDFVGNQAIDLILKKAENISKEEELKIETSPILENLNRRLEMFARLEVVKNGASDFKVTKQDSISQPEFEYDWTYEADEFAGHRMATFQLFLSDVKHGGYTVLPDVDVYAKPVKGSGVLWYNSRLNGRPDKRMLRGECPVILGSKIVANVGIYQNENMFRQPCSLFPGM